MAAPTIMAIHWACALSPLLAFRIAFVRYSVLPPAIAPAAALPLVRSARTAPTAAWRAIFSGLPSFQWFFSATTWIPFAASSPKRAAVS